MRRRRIAACLALLAGVVLLGATPLGAVTSWPTYHGTPDRQGAPGASPALVPAAHAWASPVLDGLVYAEPLVVGTRVYVVTENDSFYALDATTGQVVWRTHVGTPVPRRFLPCGNIDPLGITGTPVIDTATGVIYAVAEELTPAIHHQLVGVDTRTGNVVQSRGADPPGSIPVNQQQRPALALANGSVYWAFGGLDGDCAQYHGWVVASPTNGPGALRSYRVPTTREGAIWGTSGIAVDGSGNLLVTTGNGENIGPSDPYDHGNSLIELSPALAELGAWAPTNWKLWNFLDADLGSTGPLLLPNGDVFVVGKQEVAYLIGPAALAGTHVGDASALAQLAMTGCAAFGGDAFDAATSTIYVPCSTGIRAVHVNLGGTPPTLSTVAGFHGPAAAGSPIVAGGVVWVTDYDGGLLYALDPSTGATRERFGIGHARHFASVAADGGRVFVAADTRVFAFSGPGTAAPAPARGYLVDAFGGVHPYGGAPGAPAGAYWRGWDIARGIAVRRDGGGQLHGGYVLDAFGGVHAFGGAPTAPSGAYWRGLDLARAIVTNPCDASGDSGYVLDGWGGVHAYGGAPALRVGAYWRGWDIARGLALEPCTAGFVRGEVVDGWGALHPIAQLGHSSPAAPRPSASWRGRDLVRGAVATGSGQGLVLDAFGALHGYGGAVNAYASASWPPFDLARGLSVVPGTSEGYVVDAFGAPRGYGGAAPVAAHAYWPGRDIARGIG